MAEQRQARFFDTVSMSYTASVPGGEVIEQVPESAPVTLNLGSGRVLMVVEAAMMGMQVGESRTFNIQPEDAFGRYDPKLKQDVPRAVFGDRIDPQLGMVLALSVERNGRKQQVPATVLAADHQSVTVDYNHPLAGKTITYTVKLLAIGS